MKCSCCIIPLFFFHLHFLLFWLPYKILTKKIQEVLLEFIRNSKFQEWNFNRIFNIFYNIRLEDRRNSEQNSMKNIEKHETAPTHFSTSFLFSIIEAFIHCTRGVYISRAILSNSACVRVHIQKDEPKFNIAIFQSNGNFFSALLLERIKPRCAAVLTHSRAQLNFSWLITAIQTLGAQSILLK